MKKMIPVFSRRIMLFCLLLSGLQFFPGKAFAYEEDTHFIMTYVLLRSAGFSDKDALLVAAVDQGMDDSPETVANGDVGPVSGVYPNIDEEWIWHALDSAGTMTAKGIVARKDLLFNLALLQSNYRNKLILLGVFFHYQQDTWAHRHHYGIGPLAKRKSNHLSYDTYTTYNTPTGHAKDGHMPDRPPFDPVCALMCLEDGIHYAKKFLLQTGGTVSPMLAGYQPVQSSLDENWLDEKQGKFFNQVKIIQDTSTAAGLAANYLSRLIHAQINAYSYSKTNPPLPGFQTPNKANFDSVRSNLQIVCNSFAAQLGTIVIPSQQDKSAMGFTNITTAALLALNNNMIVSKFNADSLLRPGDFVFKYLGTDNKTGLPLVGVAFEKMITAGQMAYKAGSKVWNSVVNDESAGVRKAMAKGNPNSVHMGIYIGNGKVAEAYGTSLDGASINKWDLFADHNFQSWFVFRPTDTVFARLVTEVAANWATGRIKYLIPVQAAVTNSWFGPMAKEKALLYGEAYSSIGGPPSITKMFCSQFAIAVAQSVAIRLYLTQTGTLVTAEQLDQLPAYLKLDSFSSPVTVFGEWEKSGAFEMIGPVYIQENPM